jgi:hypothetical protein
MIKREKLSFNYCFSDLNDLYMPGEALAKSSKWNADKPTKKRVDRMELLIPVKITTSRGVNCMNYLGK